LPTRDEARTNKLKELRDESRTLVFYEAPHRLLSSLQSMAEAFGPDRHAVVARELTKMYESVLYSPLSELIAHYETNANEQRGEIVILVAGAEERHVDKAEVVPETVLTQLMEELPLKQAVALASKITGERKNTLYELALAKKA
jgi:16S rRNA (cytidine1402-2'-O)-methyltransferase